MKSAYLQHMGIERWVLRPVLKNTDHRPVLVVGFVKNSLVSVDKAQALFQQMMKSIGLQDKDIHTMLDAAQLPLQLAHLTPRVILVLGPLSLLNGYSTRDIPVIETYHPAHLLIHQTDKKQAYHDLLRVQRLVRSCAD
jgi:hypothetical protein